jgi:hypothetical protein
VANDTIAAAGKLCADLQFCTASRRMVYLIAACHCHSSSVRASVAYAAGSSKSTGPNGVHPTPGSANCGSNARCSACITSTRQCCRNLTKLALPVVGDRLTPIPYVLGRGDGRMACDNEGDERLGAALANPMIQVLQSHLTERLLAEADSLVTSDRKALVGDIGELTLRNIKERLGHEIISTAFGYSNQPTTAQMNDLITVGPDGSLEVYDSKASASMRVLKITGSNGVPNLPKPTMGRVKSGDRQLSDSYNKDRVGQALTFDGDPRGDAPQGIAVKINLKSHTYQEWRVDESGRLTDPVGPAQDCSVEIAEAIAELAEDAAYTRLGS